MGEADIKMVTLKMSWNWCCEEGQHRLGLEEEVREGFPEEVMPSQCSENEYLLRKMKEKEALKELKRTG